MKKKNKKNHNKSNLLKELNNEHDLMIDLFDIIEVEISQFNNWPKALSHLSDLRSLIYKHFIKENIQLYAFLKNKFKMGSKERNTVCDIQRKTLRLNTIIRKLMSKYLDTEYDENNFLKIEFINDLKLAKSALIVRIKNEEERLHPIY